MADSHDAFPQNAAVLEKKVDGILASASFMRAPILSRLLRYLLDQTLAGEADNLKAYTVAVEGLDRSPDFDAQFDSYPRVQMVRLRKALESYYSENPELPEPDVYLCARSYRLQLAPRETAYPNLARTILSAVPAMASGIATLPTSANGRFSSRLVVFLMGFAAAALIALTIVLVVREDGPEAIATRPDAVRAPIVELNVRDAATPGHAGELSDLLSQALTRSWVTQVRAMPADTAAGGRPSAYRILLREGGGRIDAQLVNARSNMILWTDSVEHGDSADLRGSLQPMIAELVGPFGVIARTEAARLTPRSTGSYACLLRYFAFVKARDVQERDRVAHCLAQPVNERQLTATINAVRSFFTLESEFGTDGRSKMDAADRYAALAEEADANDPYTRFAKARLAYLQSNCAAGLFYADRAIAANPYDAMIVTILSGLTAPCSRERAAQMLDQAYRVRNDNDVTMRSSLIIATIAQGQNHRLRELGFVGRPPAGPQLPGYLLTQSLIAASLGQRTEAAAMWKELRALPSTPKISDDNLLKSIILSDSIRAHVLEVLRNGGAIAA